MLARHSNDQTGGFAWCSALTTSCISITADNFPNKTTGCEVDLLSAQCENQLAVTKAV